MAVDPCFLNKVAGGLQRTMTLGVLYLHMQQPLCPAGAFAIDRALLSGPAAGQHSPWNMAASQLAVSDMASAAGLTGDTPAAWSSVVQLAHCQAATICRPSCLWKRA